MGRTLAILLAVSLAGCLPAPRKGFESSESVERMRAISRAAEDDDPAAIPDLVTMLESDDPAVRLLAIRALEDLTGQTLGYRHEDPEWRRREAVERWVEWVRRSQA